MNDRSITFDQIAHLECPDCGGKLLRGPRYGFNHNLTCRDCQMRFNATITFPARPRSDIDFIAGAANIVDWVYVGKDAAGSAFYDTAYPERLCDFCEQPYTGPGVYCCLSCAIDDA